MRTRKGIVSAIIVTVFLVGIVCVGLFRDFDAQGYVRAILNQRFQGEVAEAQGIIGGISEKELLRQYEEGVEAFVADYISSGVEMDEELESKFVDLCKDIFGEMKYEVRSVEKISRTEFDVSVEFQPADIYHQFIQAIPAELGALKQKAENGEYQGTKEEINSRMQSDFLNRSYEVLKEASKNIQYEEPKTMVFKVERTDENGFSMKEDEISTFITKILRLDEIQD